MKWKYCDITGKISKSSTSFQVDSVGNIFQQSGGVKPKTCQKCGIKFKSKIKESKIIQKVPVYECTKCNFKNTSGSTAYDHKIETDHKIEKIFEDRIAGEIRTITGNVAHIKKTKTDVNILCGNCYGI